LVKIGDIHGINMDAWNKLYKLIKENRQTTVVSTPAQPNSETPPSNPQGSIEPTHVSEPQVGG
jgi:hypothetical protein